MIEYKIIYVGKMNEKEIEDELKRLTEIGFNLNGAFGKKNYYFILSREVNIKK